MKRLLITCDQQWASTKNVSVDLVHFREMGDTHPFQGPVINARTVVFENCDKNFVYYWAIPRVLPSARYVYLFSHPCEPLVFQTLNKMGVLISIDEYWQRYAEKWAPTMLKEGKIKIMKQCEAKNLIHNLDRTFHD